MAGSHKIFYAGAPIGSLSSLAKTLGFTEHRIAKIASNIGGYYTIFDKQVKGKLRTLAEPVPELKILQKRIISRIFCHLEFPKYLHGGIKAEDPRDFYSNALSHCNAEVAITVDIKSFFPSISKDLVETVFLRLFEYPPIVAKVLSQLTTLDGSLPQGSPTSSYISNLVMWEKEYKIASKFESQGFVYTRLIDDMTVSCTKKLSNQRITKITKDIVDMVRAYGFKPHPTKTNIYSRCDPENLMIVTGLWLNRGIPKLEKYKRKEISDKVIEVKKMSMHGEGTYEKSYHDNFNSVSGKVALLERLNHARAGRLRKILDEVPPTFDLAEMGKINKLVRKFGNKAHDREKVGYLKNFYKLQHAVAIVKRTNPILAKKLQEILNKKRPTKNLREFL